MFLLYSGFSYLVQLKCEERKKVFNRTAEKEHQIPLFELSFTVSYLLFFRACLSMNPASLLFIIILSSHFHWGRKRAERILLWLFYKNPGDFSFLVGLSQEWNLWLIHSNGSLWGFLKFETEEINFKQEQLCTNIRKTYFLVPFISSQCF